MEAEIAKYLGQLGGLGLLLFFFIRYFMDEVKRKDEQNQQNLNRFIELQMESNKVHAQTALTLAAATTQIADMYSVIRSGELCMMKKSNRQ